MKEYSCAVLLYYLCLCLYLWLQGETGEYLAIILSSSTSEDLWQRYFMDLTQERLCLQSINKGLMPQMLKEIFQKITSATANPEETCAVTPADEVYFTWNGYQIISLHLAFHTHSQYFARIVPVLKQFDDLQILADYLSFPPISTSLESILTNPTELCVYTIDLLFSFVHCANSTEDVSSENFLWYWFYQKIVSHFIICWMLFILQTIYHFTDVHGRC